MTPAKAQDMTTALVWGGVIAGAVGLLAMWFGFVWDFGGLLTIGWAMLWGAGAAISVGLVAFAVRLGVVAARESGASTTKPPA